ncbi:MAG: DUF814 domain-containing protein [DPANN group archaeon]|nr:DUF814 domain-containing protein [DPANN group archaeon]
MRLTLFYDQTAEQNASAYFEKAKKMKKKVKGAEEAILKLQKRLAEKEARFRSVLAEKQEVKKTRKKEWYEKYRWFFTSEGFLVIGGRDATSNDIIVKKHVEKDDLVFHTDMAGSPFFVIKTGGKQPKEPSIREAADATASFSRGWTKGLTTLATFWVKPEQVSKTPNPGEFLPRGAFMIRGKTNYVDVKMEIAIGVADGRVVSGPLSAVKAQTEDYLLLHQGEMKKSDAAKQVARRFKADLDEVMHMMPPGNCSISPRD